MSICKKIAGAFLVLLSILAHEQARGSVQDCAQEDLAPHSAVTQSSKGNMNGTYWARATSCISVPFAEVWEKVQTEAFVSFDEVDEVQVTPIPPESTPNWDNGLSARYTVHVPIFGNVRWIIQWLFRQEMDNGTIEYSKVSGTSHIELWHGAIHITQASDMNTYFEAENFIKAARQNADTAEDTLLDFIEKIIRP